MQSSDICCTKVSGERAGNGFERNRQVTGTERGGDPSPRSVFLPVFLGFQRGGQKGQLRWRKEQARSAIVLPSTALPSAERSPRGLLTVCSLGQWPGHSSPLDWRRPPGPRVTRGLALAGSQIPGGDSAPLRAAGSAREQKPSPFPVRSLMNSLTVASTLRIKT